MLFYKNHLVKYCIPARTKLFLELQEEYIRNAVLCLVTQFCPTLCHPMDYRPPGSFVYGQEYWSGLPCSPSGDLPDPGIKPRSPSLQVDSLPTEPSGKPKNTGVGSHSCLQGIFPTQGSNIGLLNCRQVLYLLSHQAPKTRVYPHAPILGTISASQQILTTRNNSKQKEVKKTAMGKERCKRSKAHVSGVGITW